MRINSMNSINQIYQANSTTKVTQNTRTNQSDSLEISNTAKDFQTALNAAKASEDVRAEKVEQIKKQMQEGTYQVSNKDIAEKMVNRIFDDIF